MACQAQTLPEGAKEPEIQSSGVKAGEVAETAATPVVPSDLIVFSQTVCLLLTSIYQVSTALIYGSTSNLTMTVSTFNIAVVDASMFEV